MRPSKKRTFSLVWGRRLFFGFIWPLMMVMSLAFVYRGGIPDSVLSSFITVLQLISQSGVLVALSYFLLYTPIVYLIPTYYFCRIWAILILNAITALFALELYSYTSFELHLNSFVIQHLLKQVADLGSMAYLAIIPFFFLTLFLWMKGNRIWYFMQRKFMNVSRNWYVWLIFISFIMVQFFNVYQQVNASRSVQRSIDQFPIKLPIPKMSFLVDRISKESLPKDVYFSQKKKLKNYPSEIVCESPKNLIFIAYESYPDFAKHFSSHGLKLKNNFSTNTDAQSYIDEMIYSLPNSLKKQIAGKSQLISTLDNYNYHMEFFSNNRSVKINGIEPSKKMVEVNNWVTAYLQSSSTKNFALFFYIDQNKSYEKTINHLLINLGKAGHLEDTIFVVTGKGRKKIGEDLIRNPVTLIWKDLSVTEVTKSTSSYDIIPTILKEGMRCKAEIKSYSFGENFLNKSEPNYFIYSKNNDPRVWVKKMNVTFSLQNLDYFSKDLNTSEVLDLRKYYFTFFK